MSQMQDEENTVAITLLLKRCLKVKEVKKKENN